MFHTRKQCQYKPRVWSWFLSLSWEERANVLLWEDKNGAELLKQMFKKQWNEGSGFFFTVDDPALRKLAEAPCWGRAGSEPVELFCFKKLSLLDNYFCYPESVVEVDRQLEESVRLCDTREYCDTLTVASYILKDGEKFLNIMEVVSRGGFLNSPCRVKQEGKQWVWETPTWFEGMGYYSLGTYVAHKLEQAIWRRFWQSNSIDPRKNRSSMGGKMKREQSFNFAPNTQGLQAKTHLMNFWDGLTNEERTRIVGRIGEIVEEVLIGDRKENKILDWQKPLSTLLDLLLTLLDEKMMSGFHYDPSVSIGTKMHSHTEHEKNFIEFVYFSPMHRAFEPLDLIVRRMGKCIQSAYTEKIAMDLILGEEKDKKKKKAKKRKEKVVPKKKEQTRKGGKKKTDALDSDNSENTNKRLKSKSCIREKPQPTVEDKRLSKSQPGSPRQHYTAQPASKRRNSSPLTPDFLGSTSAPNTNNNNIKQNTENKSGNTSPARPKKENPPNNARKARNGIMLSEGLRSGQSQDDCNLRSGGQVATTAKQRRRRRKRARNKMSSSTDGNGIMVGSHSLGDAVEDSEVGDAPFLASRQTTGGRGLRDSGGGLCSSLSGDNWGGSVSDSALEDEEIEVEKMSQFAPYNPPAKHKATPPAPQAKSPVTIRHEMPSRKEKEWEEEEAEEESIGGTVEEYAEKRNQPTIPAINMESLKMGEDENVHDIYSPERIEIQRKSDEWKNEQRQQRELEGEKEELFVEKDREKEKEQEDADVKTEDFGGSGYMARGRPRLRSCSDSPTENTVTREVPAPLLATVRRTRARSQPPSKEAPEQSHPTLLAAKADSLPELQLAEFHNTSYEYAKARNNADDNGKPASCRNVQLNGTNYPRTRSSRYSYRPNLVQIVQEEREKEWERGRAEKVGMLGQQPNRPTPSRTASAPLLHSATTTTTTTRPSTSIMRGVPQAGVMRPMGPAYQPTTHYSHPFPSGPGDTNQQQYSRVSHLLTQSLSDVERVLFLHREIEDYVKYIIGLTSVRRVHQETMLQKMTEIVKQIWGPTARVECYGSFATGLCIPSSDLDIVVIISAPYVPNIDSPGMGDAILRRDWSPIQILAEELKKQEWLVSLQAIETAKVPVIKVISQVDGNNILIDITFSIDSPKGETSPAEDVEQQWDGWNGSVGRDEHSGIAAAKLVKRYMRSIPALTPIALVLKQFLHERGLNNTYTGGISSYCLVLMIVAFLRLNVPQSRPRHAYGKGKGASGSASSGGTSSDLPEEENLGATLLGFLRFFGMQFDFDKMGISLHNGGMYFYLREPCNTLVIMDPFQPDRNIGHSVFGMWRVKAAFKYAFSALISPYTTNFAPTLLSRMLQGYDSTNPYNSPPPVQHDQENDVYLPPWVPRHAAYLNLEFGSGDGRNVFP